MGDALLPHLTTDPDIMSRADAERIMQQLPERFMEAGQQETTAEGQQANFEAGIENVRQQVLDKLNATGRFGEDVTTPYAALTAHWYGTQAARLGTTPDELFQRYPLDIRSEGQEGTFGQPGQPRADWGDFPPVETLHPLKTLEKADPDLYARAKGGDRQAAHDLVKQVLTPENIEHLRGKLGDSKPVVVPVHAQEADGINHIPMAFAHRLADGLGLSVDHGIVQSVKANHTHAGAFERLARQAEFTGDVVPGQHYLLADDTATMGGTLAALRGYIESRGGKVDLATTLWNSGDVVDEDQYFSVLKQKGISFYNPKKNITHIKKQKPKRPSTALLNF